MFQVADTVSWETHETLSASRNSYCLPAGLSTVMLRLQQLILLGSNIRYHIWPQELQQDLKAAQQKGVAGDKPLARRADKEGRELQLGV